MPKPISDLVGRDNMTLDARSAVVALIQAMPTDAIMKRFYFTRWLRELGEQPTARELDEVAAL